MAESVQAQQAAADELGKLNQVATLVCHLPSQIVAPDGILLTTYDQPYSQIEKAERTICAFPTFGAAENVMSTFNSTDQSCSFVFETHANSGPVEIAAKAFDFLRQTSISDPGNQTNLSHPVLL